MAVKVRFLVCVAIAASSWAPFVAAQSRQTVNVPAEIVRQLEGRGAAVRLIAYAVELNGDRNSEFIVTGQYGIGGICGANNCLHWIFSSDPRDRTYRLLLDAGAVQSVVAQSASNHGYRNIVTTAHASAFDHVLRTYWFDGTEYRLHQCIERHAKIDDDSPRANNSPRVTEEPC